jgi:uncharacterized RDD family membrane protein YckC
MENIENKKIGINASYPKRVFGFSIDISIVCFLRILFMQIFIITEKHSNKIKEFIADFKDLFGTVQLNNIQDQHIRYFVNSEVFSYCVQALLLACFSGVIYNFLCFVFLKSSTIGQKIMSLKVVNLNNVEKPSVLKLLFRAFLIPFPIIVVSILGMFQFLYMIDFHLYAPIQGNLASNIIVKITYISNPYTMILSAVFFILFWYGMYLLSDKLLLSDIISRTRVIKINKNYNVVNSNVDSVKDIVYFGDKFISKIEAFTEYLNKKLADNLNYIWKKFKKNKK